MKQKLQEIVKMPLPSFPPPLGLCLKASLLRALFLHFLQFYVIWHHRKGSPNSPLLAHGPFYVPRDELKSRMQIKFACLYCCPMSGDPRP